MSPKDLKFDIGDWVKFTNYQYRHKNYETKEITWKTREIKEKIGRIVGIARRQEGVYHGWGGTYIYDGDYDAEPAYLEVKQVHSFYEVRIGWINKPFLVREEDLQLCSLEEIGKFPLLHTNQDWSDLCRKSMSEEMKGWPRNKKGQWIKEKI